MPHFTGCARIHHMAEPFAEPVAEEKQRNWIPMVVGLVLVILIVAGIALVGRNNRPATTQQDPYAEKLKVGDAKLSAADNFVGGTVTYLDFMLTNNGDKTITSGQVEATLRNTLNEVVQKEVVPIHVLRPNQLGGYPDLVDLSVAPLGPGKTETIRVTLEHVSGDWNQSAPELRFLNLKSK
jgi:hypothetical protein